MKIIASSTYSVTNMVIETGIPGIVGQVTRCSTDNKDVAGNICRTEDVSINIDGSFNFIPSDFPKFRYMSDKYIDMVKNGDKHFTELINNFQKHDQTDKFILGEVKNPSAENIIHADHGCHLFKRYPDWYPLSTTFVFNYISIFNNYELKFDEAFEHLKNHPCVQNIEIEDIPYYNADCGKDKGFNLRVKFPQSTIDAIWDAVKNNDYPSYVLKSVIEARVLRKQFDPLGLSPFIRSEKEQAKISKQFDEDGDSFLETFQN